MSAGAGGAFGPRALFDGAGGPLHRSKARAESSRRNPIDPRYTRFHRLRLPWQGAPCAVRWTTPDRRIVAAGGSTMKLGDLSGEDQALVLAFFEIARIECVGNGWTDIEPMLAKCWTDSHRQASQLAWHEVAPFVRSACVGD